MLDKFKSRKFLLALFAQITGLLVLFLPQHENSINQAVAQGGALLLMALTATGWIKAEASIDAASVDNSRSPTVDIDPPQNNLLIVLLLASLMLQGGCASAGMSKATPADLWYQTRADLSAANRVYLSYSKTADLSDPKQAETVVKWGRKLQQARALLAQAKLLIDQPDSGYGALIDQIEAILIELAQPDPEIDDDTSRSSSPDPGTAWRLRDREPREATTRPGPERWADHARAA